MIEKKKKNIGSFCFIWRSADFNFVNLVDPTSHIT